MDDLGNSQPTQNAKDTKFGDLLFGKCSNKKAQSVAGQPYAGAGEMRDAPAAIPAGARKRDCQRQTRGGPPLPTDMNACDIHRRLTKCLRMLYQQKHCQLGLKETEIRQNEGKLSDFQNSTDRKQANKTIQLQTHASFQANERITGRAAPWGQRAEPRRQRQRP